MVIGSDVLFLLTNLRPGSKCSDKSEEPGIAADLANERIDSSSLPHSGKTIDVSGLLEKFLARVEADALRLTEETLKVCNKQFAKQSASDTTAMVEGLSRELSKTDTTAFLQSIVDTAVLYYTEGMRNAGKHTQPGYAEYSGRPTFAKRGLFPDSVCRLHNVGIYQESVCGEALSLHDHGTKLSRHRGQS